MLASKSVERDVLKVFQEEIPSIHFSDKSEIEFREWTSDVEMIFRELFHLPPELFLDKSVIDLGAGTGENTVHLANWGANCTLVEMNLEALNIAKQVFAKYATGKKHQFIHSSIFDYADTKQYDFVSARGSLHHTNEKERAFSILASLLRPGGYLILGMSSPIGGFQNNLQRAICFQFGKTGDEIVKIAEQLFSEDIDRAAKYSLRTRRSIIFDRWVVPKQDDPTVEDILNWFQKNGIHFYHAQPPILIPAFSDSTSHRPKFDWRQIQKIGGYTEAHWLVHKDADAVEVFEALQSLPEFSRCQAELAKELNNIEPQSKVVTSSLRKKIDAHLASLDQLSLTDYLVNRHHKLFSEIKYLLNLMDSNDLSGIEGFLKKTSYLFRGMNGLRSVNFVGWKPNR